MFNDPIAARNFYLIAHLWNFQFLIETGTHMGQGAMEASRSCPVKTIELNPVFRDTAISNWKQAGFQEEDGKFVHPDGREITSFLGSSPEVMAQILKTKPEGAVGFYLDAHWGDYWPLRDELKVIADSGVNCGAIIIHDFYVPGKPWQHYIFNGQRLDLEYVKPLLDAINPRFNISYNQEADGNKVGIMYAVAT